MEVYFNRISKLESLEGKNSRLLFYENQTSGNPLKIYLFSHQNKLNFPCRNSLVVGQGLLALLHNVLLRTKNISETFPSKRLKQFFVWLFALDDDTSQDKWLYCCQWNWNCFSLHFSQQNNFYDTTTWTRQDKRFLWRRNGKVISLLIP